MALTQSIRVGAGGIKLPNQQTLQVAEIFRTLSALYPDRIGSRFGCAPGTKAFLPRVFPRHAPGLILKEIGKMCQRDQCPNLLGHL